MNESRHELEHANDSLVYLGALSEQRDIIAALKRMKCQEVRALADSLEDTSWRIERAVLNIASA
jgi:hypothetical protein